MLLYLKIGTEIICSEMTPSQRRAFIQLQDLPAAKQDSDQWVTLDSVMDGDHQLNVSHAGGELSALTDMAEEWDKSCVFWCILPCSTS